MLVVQSLSGVPLKGVIRRSAVHIAPYTAERPPRIRVGARGRSICFRRSRTMMHTSWNDVIQTAIVTVTVSVAE